MAHPSQTVAKVTASVVLLDQFTKVIAQVTQGTARPGWLIPVDNPEAALGIIGGSQMGLIALGVAALILFGLYLHFLTNRGLSTWTAGLLLGGAVSNLIDRILFGSVRDFIWLPGVIVNFADLALAAGALSLLMFQVTANRRSGLSTAL